MTVSAIDAKLGFSLSWLAVRRRWGRSRRRNQQEWRRFQEAAEFTYRLRASVV